MNKSRPGLRLLNVTHGHTIKPESKTEPAETTSSRTSLAKHSKSTPRYAKSKKKLGPGAKKHLRMISPPKFLAQTTRQSPLDNLNLAEIELDAVENDEFEPHVSFTNSLNIKLNNHNHTHRS